MAPSTNPVKIKKLFISSDTRQATGGNVPLNANYNFTGLRASKIFVEDIAFPSDMRNVTTGVDDEIPLQYLQSDAHNASLVESNFTADREDVGTIPGGSYNKKELEIPIQNALNAAHTAIVAQTTAFSNTTPATHPTQWLNEKYQVTYIEEEDAYVINAMRWNFILNFATNTSFTGYVSASNPGQRMKPQLLGFASAGADETSSLETAKVPHSLKSTIPPENIPWTDFILDLSSTSTIGNILTGESGVSLQGNLVVPIHPDYDCIKKRYRSSMVFNTPREVVDFGAPVNINTMTIQIRDPETGAQLTSDGDSRLNISFSYEGV